VKNLGIPACTDVPDRRAGGACAARDMMTSHRMTAIFLVIGFVAIVIWGVAL
jgi:hypothetical protein